MWGPNWEAGHAPQQEASPCSSDQHFWTTLHTPTRPPSTSIPPSCPSCPSVGASGGKQVPGRTTRLEEARGLQGASSAHYPTRLIASPPPQLAPAFPYHRDADGCLSLFPSRVQSPRPQPTRASRLHVPLDAHCPALLSSPFRIKRPCLLPPRAAPPPLLLWHETCNRLWPPAARAPSSSTEQPLLSIPVPRRLVPRTSRPAGTCRPPLHILFRQAPVLPASFSQHQRC